MALRTVLKDDESVLHERTRKVVDFDERLSLLLDDMLETMISESGVGLAAPQIGILKSICVISRHDDELFELVNPVIVSSEGSQLCSEGCLSLPGVTGKVVRPMRIVVQAQNRKGEHFKVEVSGRLANIFCHEIDHLEGILFTDKMEKN